MSEGEAQYMVILTEPEIRDLQRTHQERLYMLKGQLLVATQNSMNRKLSGSRRQRAERACATLPGAIERAESIRQAMVDALSERNEELNRLQQEG